VTAPKTILDFAEFGVVLLLFLVGLELNPKRVWQLRKPIFGMGAVQVLVTLLVVAGAGWAFGLTPKVALVVGMGFAMSSTAIGSPCCRKRACCPRPAARRASPCCCSRIWR
jgi:Kef-type K+ transport system membrane component KefB